MQRRPRVRARLEELRFEIDELSKRIDEHIANSKQYRSIHGTVENDLEQQSGEQTSKDGP